MPPARTTIGTSGLLIAGALIEIDLIGQIQGAKRDAVVSSNPKPLANYTEAFRTGDLVFAAGQLASDFATGVAKEARVDPAFPYYGSSIKKQTRYILENLKHTFEAAGSSLDQVVKAQVFLTDLNDFCAFDEVWKEFFKTPPARTTVGTSGLLIDGCRIEIDLIGVVGADASAPVSSVAMRWFALDLSLALGLIDPLPRPHPFRLPRRRPRSPPCR